MEGSSFDIYNNLKKIDRNAANDSRNSSVQQVAHKSADQTNPSKRNV